MMCALENARVGDRVRCRAPGSWCHGLSGTVIAVNVVSTDDICGYAVRVDGYSGYTVLPPAELEVLDRSAAATP